MIEAEAVAVQTPRGFLGVFCEQSFIENVKQLQSSNAFYKNISLQKQAVSYFDQYFYQKELLEFCAGVEKTHGVMMVEYAGKEFKMLCNPRHMMTYQLEFRTSSALQQAEGYLGGGHVGLYVDELVKKQMMQIISEEQLVGGCRALEIKHVFGNNIAKKTIWPKDWTAQLIMDAIKETWHNQIYADFELLADKSVGVVVGKTNENMLVVLYVKKLSNGTLKLKTAYPYSESFLGFKLLKIIPSLGIETKMELNIYIFLLNFIIYR